MENRKRELAGVSLVVLAAGIGSRYGGLKQIEPVGPNGELLIEYSIFDALSVGIQRIVFVIQEDQEDLLRELLAEKLRGRCDMIFSHQKVSDVPQDIAVCVKRRKPWGTGHAVLSCRDAVGGAFAVINADDFYGRESFRQLGEYLANTSHSGNGYALVGFELRKTLTPHGTVSRGICTADESGFLVRIDERTRIGLHGDSVVFCDEADELHLLPDGTIASMNMWAFPRGFMLALGCKFARFLNDASTDMVRDEFFLPGAVSDLIAEKRAEVRILSTSEKWMGVTYRDDIPRVRERIQELIKSGVYPHLLWEDKG